MGLKEDLVDVNGQLTEKRATMTKFYEEAGPDLDMGKVKVFSGDSTAKVEEHRKLNDELKDLSLKADELTELVATMEEGQRLAKGEEPKRPRFAGGQDPQKRQEAPELKSWGELFVESEAYTGKKAGSPQGPSAEIELPKATADVKTLMTTSAGWVPETTRTGRLVEFATRPVQTLDLMPMGRTSQAAVVYMEETTLTNAAAETSEAGTFPESALALTEQSNTVRKIATFLPVTDEQLEDVDGTQSYVQNRLGFFLNQRLDSQVLVGNGAPPNLRGFLNVVGVQTQARGADPSPDAIYKAMTLVRVVGRSVANGIVVHPTNWQTVKLLRTADGIYIWGNPADASPDRVWGLNVAQSDAITLNTALVGDFARQCELVMRRDVTIQVTNSHSTFFIEGKQAIRADMRVALVVYRPTAFCLVTGLN